MIHRFALSLTLLCAALVQAGCAQKGGAQEGARVDDAQAEQHIPFANQGGIRNWQPVDDSSLLIQDQHGQWYLARLQSATSDLAFAEQIIFLTEPGGSFGRLGVLVIKGVRHPVSSLVKAPPPSKR